MTRAYTILALLVGPPFILTIYRAAVAGSMEDFVGAIVVWFLVFICAAVGGWIIAASEAQDDDRE